MIGSFRAVHCAGAFIPDARAITAMSLLFERIVLPNNLGAISEFARRYQINTTAEYQLEIRGEADPFPDLTEQQRKTAAVYLHRYIEFLVSNHKLVGPIFET